MLLTRISFVEERLVNMIWLYIYLCRNSVFHDAFFCDTDRGKYSETATQMEMACFPSPSSWRLVNLCIPRIRMLSLLLSDLLFDVPTLLPVAKVAPHMHERRILRMYR
jgi:hypothetical protein